MVDVPAHSESPLLSVRNLTAELPQRMDRRFAVEDVSFDLMAGEILCIVGESGSGKSVTANAIMGLLPRKIGVTRGEILFNGTDLLRMSPASLRHLRGRSIAMIFQDPMSALNPLMTIGRQISEVMETHGVGTSRTRREKVVQLLDEVGLPTPELLQHQYPFRLSGGQRQRVMIAMALALDPDILIADEPTTALDVTTQAQILRLIRTIQKRKQIGVMFITHDFGVVEEMANRVIVMRQGKIVEAGPARDILAHPADPYTRQLIDAVPRMRTGGVGPRGGDTVIEVRHLSKTYATGGLFGGHRREVRAIDDVSFDIRHGRTLGIVGESGSGKSSLGKQLLKLADGASGEIVFQGQNIVALKESEFRPLRPYIQMIFQDPFSSLNPRHSIGHILTAGPRARGVSESDARHKALGLLDMVGLKSGAYERFPHEFSGGQRQRIGIARALMFEPLVLVADECVSALDVSIQQSILALLRQVQDKTGVAIVFITHDLRVASQICDDILVLHRGRIVEQGAPDQIFHAPAHAYTRELVASIPGA